MQILSATEAIRPALTRTREVLFGQRRFGTFWKIALVATLAAMGDGLNARYNYSKNANTMHNNGHVDPHVAAMIAALAGAAVLITLVLAVLFIAIFYVGNRMQFVLFDMVLTRRTEVTPPWRAYANRTWRWIGAKLALFVGFIVVAAIAGLPLIVHFIRAHRANGNVGSGHWMGLLAGSAAVVFLLFVGLFVVSSLLHDFVLPAVALEDAPVFSTLGRLWTLCKTEPGEIALYLLLRFVFAIVLAIATFVCIIIFALVVGLVLGIIGAILFVLLHKLGAVAVVVMVVLLVAEALLFLVLLLAADVAIVGWYMTFQQAWALFFLGGRYTLLGEALDRSMPPPPPAYVFPSYEAPVAAPMSSPAPYVKAEPGVEEPPRDS